MRYPRLCAVEYFYEGSQTWLSCGVETQSQTGAWCKGFVSGWHSYAKCPKMRIMDYITKEVVQEFDGHDRKMVLS